MEKKHPNLTRLFVLAQSLSDEVSVTRAFITHSNGRGMESLVSIYNEVVREKCCNVFKEALDVYPELHDRFAQELKEHEQVRQKLAEMDAAQPAKENT